MVLLALYHYKHLPELGYFLLYLVIMSVWALMVFFLPGHPEPSAPAHPPLLLLPHCAGLGTGWRQGCWG